MGKGLRILLVDDHRVLRTGMKMLLSSQSDFQVVDEASDGKEALEKLAEEKIDLVLMDLSMPGMGGFTTSEPMAQITASGFRAAA